MAISCSVHCVGRLACKLFENMKREAAAVKIQKHTRRHRERKAYKSLHLSVLVLQTGLRAMAARKQFRFRKQTKAAIIIQVNIRNIMLLWMNSPPDCQRKSQSLNLWYLQARWRCHGAASYYKKLKKGSILAQCRWRGRIARRELRKLKMVTYIKVHVTNSFSIRLVRCTLVTHFLCIILMSISNFPQAARETGALKEAKDKLEKRVEELTWRLQLEKRLRVIFISCSYFCYY